MGRYGEWMQTHTGVMFYPLDARVGDINPIDIAHALGMTCRYSGHTAHFYSVAEHSVHVSYNVPKEYALWGLLHDATEAYLTDMPRPIKRSMPSYRVAERGLMNVICEKFGLPKLMPKEVKKADRAMLATEQSQVMRVQIPWYDMPEPPLDNVTIRFWSPIVAAGRFACRLDELWENNC